MAKNAVNHLFCSYLEMMSYFMQLPGGLLLQLIFFFFLCLVTTERSNYGVATQNCHKFFFAIGVVSFTYT